MKSWKMATPTFMLVKEFKFSKGNDKGRRSSYFDYVAGDGFQQLNGFGREFQDNSNFKWLPNDSRVPMKGTKIG